MNHATFIPIAAILLTAVTSCHRSAAPESKRDPAGLRRCIPDGGSIYVEERLKDGGADIGFTVAVSLRDDLVVCLTDSLERDGWKPRTTQWLNPSESTSFGVGWRQGAGGGVIMRDDRGNILTPPIISGWIGEWEDAVGNILRYSLMDSRYRDATQNQIRCYAEYTTASAVASARKTLHLAP